jgi:hypothetical protein
MDLKRLGWARVGWIDSPWDKVQWWSHVNTAMKWYKVLTADYEDVRFKYIDVSEERTSTVFGIE